MNDQIDREFEPPLPRHDYVEDAAAVRRNTLFLRMLTLSILLHLALTPLLLLPGKRSSGVPFSSIIAVDLAAVPSPPPAPPLPAPPENPAPAAPAAEPPPEPLPEAPPTESQKLTTTVTEAVAGGREQPELLEQASLGLGLSLGYFSSLNEGRTLRDEIKLYYFTLLRQVNEQWWLTGAGSVRTPRIPVITLVIARNGELLQRYIEQGSGDREYDRHILRAIDAAAPFAPLPPTYRDRVFTVPIRMVAPLNFLLTGDSTDMAGHALKNR